MAKAGLLSCYHSLKCGWSQTLIKGQLQDDIFFYQKITSSIVHPNYIAGRLASLPQIICNTKNSLRCSSVGWIHSYMWMCLMRNNWSVPTSPHVPQSTWETQHYSPLKGKKWLAFNNVKCLTCQKTWLTSSPGLRSTLKWSNRQSFHSYKGTKYISLSILADDITRKKVETKIRDWINSD